MHTERFAFRCAAWVMFYIIVAAALGLLIAPSFHSIRDSNPSVYSVVLLVMLLSFGVAVAAFIHPRWHGGRCLNIARVAVFVFSAISLALLGESVVCIAFGSVSSFRFGFILLLSACIHTYVYVRPTVAMMNVLTLGVVIELGVSIAYSFDTLVWLMCYLVVIAVLDRMHISLVNMLPGRGIVGVLVNSRVYEDEAVPDYPLMFVIRLKDGAFRHVSILGCGDVGVVLLVSAASMLLLPSDRFVGVIAGNVFVALMTLCGGLIGAYVFIRRSFGSSHVQPGFPLICTGLVVAFLVSAIPIFGFSWLLF